MITIVWLIKCILSASLCLTLMLGSRPSLYPLLLKWGLTPWLLCHELPYCNFFPSKGIPYRNTLHTTSKLKSVDTFLGTSKLEEICFCSSLIREFSSTLQVGLPHTTPNTNTYFNLIFGGLKRIHSTRTLNSTHIMFKATNLDSSQWWKSISFNHKKHGILAIFHNRTHYPEEYALLILMSTKVSTIMS